VVSLAEPDEGGSLREVQLRDVARRSMTRDRMLQFFGYQHLPETLQSVSAPFCELAYHVVATQPMTPERTVCLRKLLEAKDCAVRNALYLDEREDHARGE
jgi:hypothetical protein